MKKTLYVLLGFTFCVTVPALAENYRASNVNVPPQGAAYQVSVASDQR